MDERPPGREDPPAWWLVVMAVPPLAVLGLAVATSTADLFPHQGDVDLYRHVAARVLGGARPYVDVSLPYPPLALVPMIVPALAWLPGDPDLSIYKALFGAWEAALLLVLAWVVRRLAVANGPADGPAAAATAPRDSTIRLTILELLAIYPLAFRFDLFPTLLAAAGVLAAVEERPAAAGMAFAAGTLAKLFPISLIPAAGLRWLGVRRPSLAPFALGLGVAFVALVLPFVVTSGPAIGQVLGYQADRGLELESLGSSVALAVGLLGGAPARTYSGFSSMNVDGPVAQAWLRIDPWLTVAGFAAVAVVMARRARLERASGGALAPAAIVRFAALSVVTLLLVNKVFSVQYVVWLLPFAALLPWRPFTVAAIAVGLSTAIHPYLFPRLIDLDGVAVAVLVARNVLLVGLAAWLAVDLWRAPRAASNRVE